MASEARCLKAKNMYEYIAFKKIFLKKLCKFVFSSWEKAQKLLTESDAHFFFDRQASDSDRQFVIETKESSDS